MKADFVESAPYKWAINTCGRYLLLLAVLVFGVCRGYSTGTVVYSPTGKSMQMLGSPATEEGSKVSSILAGAVAGAGLGAAAGTVFPVIGTAVGAGVGTVIFGTISAFKSYASPDSSRANASSGVRGASISTGSPNPKLESGKFDRRSITIIPAFYNNGNQERTTLLQAISNTPAEARYDINVISPSALEQASKALSVNPSTMKNDSLLIASIRSSGVMREIMISAGNGDSIAARLSRQRRKKDVSGASDQKISNPSADQYFTMLNGTYIVVVSLDSIKTSNATEFYGTAAVVRFTVNLDNWVNEGDISYPNPKDVVLTVIDKKNIKATATSSSDLAANSTTSLSNATGGLTGKQPIGKPEEPVNVKASKYLVKKTFDYLSSLDDFKIRAVFQNDDNGFQAGLREGVYMDMGFKVYETMLDPQGKPYSQYIGFGLVNSIGDNAADYDNLSSVYPKIGSFGQGMTAVAHEQGIEIGVTPTYCDGYYLVGLEANFNLAKYTNVRQLFVSAGYIYALEAGGAEVLSIGVNKRFDLGRLSLYTGADYWVKTNIGLNVGIDYLMSPDLSAGVRAGYRLGIISNGPTFGLRVGYALPRLF